MNFTIGEKFNRLTLLDEPKMIRQGKAKRYFAHFKCDCGSVVLKNYFEAKSGHLKSCGCAKFRHGMTHHPLYGVYRAMIGRCYDSRKMSYPRYGGRGIRVCDEWRNNRISFLHWCLEHGWAKGLQIDRINGDGYYCPENCRFVTPLENTSHRSNTHFVYFRGEKMSISSAWKISGSKIPFETVRKRVSQNKMSIDRALSKPWKNKEGVFIV